MFACWLCAVLALRSVLAADDYGRVVGLDALRPWEDAENWPNVACRPEYGNKLLVDSRVKCSPFMYWCDGPAAENGGLAAFFACGLGKVYSAKSGFCRPRHAVEQCAEHALVAGFKSSVVVHTDHGVDECKAFILDEVAMEPSEEMLEKFEMILYLLETGESHEANSSDIVELDIFWRHYASDSPAGAKLLVSAAGSSPRRRRRRRSSVANIAAHIQRHCAHSCDPNCMKPAFLKCLCSCKCPVRLCCYYLQK